MDMFWLGAAMMIASGSIHAVVNAILKSGSDKMASRAIIDASGALILLPAAWFVPLPHGAWHYLLGTSIAHALYILALLRAFSVSDYSAAYPILRGTAPIGTLILAVLLFGEQVATHEVVGIALISAALLLMLWGKHISRTGLFWALLTSASIAVYTVLDAHGIRAAPTPYSYIVWVFIVTGTVTFATLSLASRGRIFTNAREQWRPGVIAGALSILTYGLALYAYLYGPTAPLAALRETGMVTALVIATFFLKERVTPSRCVAVIGILAGIAVILLG